MKLSNEAGKNELAFEDSPQDQMSFLKIGERYVNKFLLEGVFVECKFPDQKWFVSLIARQNTYDIPFETEKEAHRWVRSHFRVQGIDLIRKDV